MLNSMMCLDCNGEECLLVTHVQTDVYEKSVCVISEIIGEITFIHMIKHPVHSYLYVLYRTYDIRTT